MELGLSSPVLQDANSPDQCFQPFTCHISQGQILNEGLYAGGATAVHTSPVVSWVIWMPQ